MSAAEQLPLRPKYRTPHLADVAERRRGVGVGVGAVAGGGVDERDAAVLVGELVGAMDAAVAGGAERGLVGAAEHGGRRGAADVAAHLHGEPIGEQQRSAAQEEILVGTKLQRQSEVEKGGWRGTEEEERT